MLETLGVLTLNELATLDQVWLPDLERQRAHADAEQDAWLRSLSVAVVEAGSRARSRITVIEELAAEADDL
ncbi:MAG: hypothetical protein V4637_21180, partial [Pseudomonadota bacterium]